MENITTKSFWQKPEGKTGILGIIGMIAGGGYLLYKALPFLISLTQNILHLSFLLLGLGALIYIVLDPKIRNLIFYLYKSFVRKITGIFIQIDPIGS
ncbi:MAG: hypothetical protein HC906_06740 [Bacteroidales bacterium]|nr:hypothetical protein [Bacteroidales bacterium]